MGKENPRFREGPGVAYGIRARKERGIGDYLIITF